MTKEYKFETGDLVETGHNYGSPKTAIILKRRRWRGHSTFDGETRKKIYQIYSYSFDRSWEVFESDLTKQEIEE